MYGDTMKRRVQRLRKSEEMEELSVMVPSSVKARALGICSEEGCTIESFVTEALDGLAEAFCDEAQ